MCIYIYVWHSFCCKNTKGGSWGKVGMQSEGGKVGRVADVESIVHCCWPWKWETDIWMEYMATVDIGVFWFSIWEPRRMKYEYDIVL